MKRSPFKILLLLLGLFLGISVAVGFITPQAPPEPPAWALKLQQEMKVIDAKTSGNLGVYVKKFGTTEEMDYSADRNWYFASTVKVPVAIAVLQLVEEGKLSLDQKLILKRSDPVDGSGEVRFRRPGSKLSLSYLIEKMLTQSDSTATDMLIRLIGENELNQRIRVQMGISGFQPLTTILQVRKDAYSFLHPSAKNLTNRHFIALKKHRSSASKYRAFAKMIRVPPRQLNEKSIESAFEKYYETGLNSGSLKAYGSLLEKLVAGELLSEKNTRLILKHMTAMITGERRIKAGLPKKIRFAQKTGTQVRRICNVGVVFIPPSEKDKWIVTACVEKFASFTGAERTLKLVGQAMAPLVRKH